MSKESILAKLEKNNTRTFFLPDLQEEITYKRMDIIDSAVNNSLPSFLASKVLNAMKKSIKGEEVEEEKFDLNDDEVKELLKVATEKLSDLSRDPTKLSMEEVVEISAQDRLAWYMYAIAESQVAQTQGGGVINAEQIGKFPDKRRNSRNAKRSVNS